MELSEKLERLGALSSKRLAGEPTELSKRLYECADEAKTLEQATPTINKTNLAEGDILVFKTNEILSKGQVASFVGMVSNLGLENKVICLEGGMDIEILSKADND